MSVGSVAVRLRYGLYVGHLSKWFVCINVPFLVVCLMVALSSFRLAYNIKESHPPSPTETSSPIFSFQEGWRAVPDEWKGGP
jgi:hypothetical protein